VAVAAERALTSAERRDGMARSQYVLECQSRGVLARVAVNDVPVWRHERASDCVTIVHVNPWLADDPTEIAIDVAGGREGEALTGELGISLVARVEGEIERELVRVELPRDACDVLRTDHGWRARHTLTVDDLARPPSMFWPDARPIVLRDDDRVAIVERVLAFQRALDVMDVKALEEAFAFRLADLARAYHVDEEELRAVLGGALERAVGDEEEDEDPRGDEGREELEASMELHLVGRDRLVWVTRSAYLPALFVPAVEPRLTLPIYVAPRDGRWTIVR
jgi:hypothetical protein